MKRKAEFVRRKRGKSNGRAMREKFRGKKEQEIEERTRGEWEDMNRVFRMSCTAEKPKLLVVALKVSLQRNQYSTIQIMLRVYL